jgi:hypothetical protein
MEGRTMNLTDEKNTPATEDVVDMDDATKQQEAENSDVIVEDDDDETDDEIDEDDDEADEEISALIGFTKVID